MTSMPHLRSSRHLLAALCLGLSLVTCQAGNAASIGQWTQAWPMDGHDPQRTNLSPLPGPTRFRLVQSRAGEAFLIAPNGRIVGLFRLRHHTVVAELSRSGRLHVLTRQALDPGERPFGVQPAGWIILAGADDRLAKALSQSGKTLWSHQDLGLSKSAVPLLTDDGRFFYPAEGHPEDGSAGLYILDQQGGLVRHLLPGTPTFGVAVAADGNIDVLTYDPSSGHSFVASYSPSFQERWQQPLATSVQSADACLCLLIGRQSVLYLADGSTVKAVDPGGQTLWQSDMPEPVRALAERPDGSIVAAGDRSLSALSNQGKNLFQLQTGSRNAGGSRTPVAAPSIAVDSAGKVFLGTADGRVVVVDSRGKVVDRVAAGGYRYGMTPGVLLGPPHTLVVSGTDGVVRVYR